jgi:hypothetical protein
MKHYLIGWGYVAIATAVIYRGARPEVPAPTNGTILGPAVAVAPAPTGSDAARWFQAIKPRCNSVEANLAVRSSPPPAGWEGTAYAAACYALANRIDDARAQLEELHGDEQNRAVGIVFDVAHPVADAGDDLSAGPIMQLVVDFWPNHYMALYHAGAAQYRLEQYDRARANLEAFLREYKADDSWVASAKQMLANMR